MFALFVWYVLIGVYTFLSMSLLVFIVIQRAFFISFIEASRFYFITLHMNDNNKKIDLIPCETRMKIDHVKT